MKIAKRMQWERENHDNRQKILNMLKGVASVEAKEIDVDGAIQYSIVVKAYDGTEVTEVFESTTHMTEHAALNFAVKEIAERRGFTKLTPEEGDKPLTTDNIALWRSDKSYCFTSSVFKASDLAKVGENIRFIMFKNKYRNDSKNRPAFFIKAVNGQGMVKELGIIEGDEDEDEDEENEKETADISTTDNGLSEWELWKKERDYLSKLPDGWYKYTIQSINNGYAYTSVRGVIRSGRYDGYEQSFNFYQDNDWKDIHGYSKREGYFGYSKLAEHFLNACGCMAFEDIKNIEMPYSICVQIETLRDGTIQFIDFKRYDFLATINKQETNKRIDGQYVF